MKLPTPGTPDLFPSRLATLGGFALLLLSACRDSIAPERTLTVMAASSPEYVGFGFSNRFFSK